MNVREEGEEEKEGAEMKRQKMEIRKFSQKTRLRNSEFQIPNQDQRYSAKSETHVFRSSYSNNFSASLFPLPSFPEHLEHHTQHLFPPTFTF